MSLYSSFVTVSPQVHMLRVDSCRPRFRVCLQMCLGVGLCVGEGRLALPSLMALESGHCSGRDTLESPSWVHTIVGAEE